MFSGPASLTTTTTPTPSSGQLYLPGRDYYDQALYDRKHSRAISQLSMQNNLRDGQNHQQEQERLYNATHPRVAMLKNTNIEKEKLSRQARRRESSRSQSLSPGKRVHYSDENDHSGKNHQTDREEFMTTRSADRRNHHSVMAEEDDSRTMSLGRRMEEDHSRIFIAGRRMEEAHSRTMSPGIRFEEDHSRNVSPARRMDYTSNRDTSYMEPPHVGGWYSLRSPSRSINADTTDEYSQDYHRYQSPSPGPSQRHGQHKSRRGERYETEKWGKGGGTEVEEEYNA